MLLGRAQCSHLFIHAFLACLQRAQGRGSSSSRSILGKTLHPNAKMKASEFKESLLNCNKPVLAGAVKLSQRKQLVDKDGKNWHDWVQAQPQGKKLSDPRRYSAEQLADFLASLTSQKPDPRAPGKELVKPRKLLKRYLPWLTDRIQHDRAAGSGSDAAAGGSSAAAGGKKHKGKQQPAAEQGSADADGAVKDQQAAAKADQVWQLMQRTRSHPRFHHWYTFDSYEKGWVTSGRPEPGSDTAAGRVPSGPWRLLGVDCEMCATSDNDKELLQVAVVDEDGSLLMQELVLPGSPVVDYRTALTGLSAADLEGVTLTRKAAAKRVAKLLSPTTVLVGHGLHHDLQALKLDHPWVIDTSMIFEFKGLSSFVPSLALLSEQLLGQPLRGRDPSAPLSSSQQQPQHDSREDASVALALVKLELQPGAAGSAPLDPPDLKVHKADLCKLCVHKLPAGTTSSSLEATAASVKASLAAACRQAGAASEAAAVESAAVEQPGDTSKQLLFLVFQHAGLANEVFAALPGSVFTDSVGRHSKRQALQGSSHKVVVRKMACHAGLAFGKDKAGDRGAKQKGGSSSSKKRKAPGAGGKRPKTAGKRPKQK